MELETNTKLELEKEVLDLLYDRKFCKEMGIDYCNIDSNDVNKVRDWVYNEYGK